MKCSCIEYPLVKTAWCATRNVHHVSEVQQEEELSLLEGYVVSRRCDHDNGTSEAGYIIAPANVS